MSEICGENRQDLKQVIEKSWMKMPYLPLHREVSAKDLEGAIERGNKSKLVKLLWNKKVDISEWAEKYGEEGYDGRDRPPFIYLEARKGKDLHGVKVTEWELWSNKETVNVGFSFEVKGEVDGFYETFTGGVLSLYERIDDTYYLNAFYSDFYIETDFLFGG